MFRRKCKGVQVRRKVGGLAINIIHIGESTGKEWENTLDK